MKVVGLCNMISPHQVPLARAFLELVGEENYRYIYTEPVHSERVKMGWGSILEDWCIRGGMDNLLVLGADVLLSGHRALKAFEHRNVEGKVTFYTSERWFKPPIGFLRLLAPSYFKMVWRFLKCLTSSTFTLLPIGIHAARDFARLMGLFKGDLRCLFRAPKVAFESKPGGAIVSLKEAISAGVLSKDEVVFGKKYGFVQIPKEHWGKFKPAGVCAKMRLWGYFVAPSAKSGDGVRGEGGHSLPIEHPPRVLWVGRMLDLKRVDVLVRACRPHPDLKRVEFNEKSGEWGAESGENVRISNEQLTMNNENCKPEEMHYESRINPIRLSLYGRGPEEQRLRKLATGCSNITFHDFVPVEQVRDLMREHDVYVLSSNGYEGWGAVVSEALEEGMKVLGTVDAGSSATILPPTHLFKAGDEKRLRTLLQNPIVRVEIGPWTAEGAVKALLSGLN